jgi:hypothetical protein
VPLWTGDQPEARLGGFDEPAVNRDIIFSHSTRREAIFETDADLLAR